jgi:hypothetical protein
MMQVNETNMRLWFAALRSGEFRQGPGYLKKIESNGTSTYCCLGVACETAMRHGVELETKNVDEADGSVFVQFNGTGSELPLEVMQWLGLVRSAPMVSQDVRAISANDALEWGFTRIADEAENYYFGSGDDTPGTD